MKNCSKEKKNKKYDLKKWAGISLAVLVLTSQNYIVKATTVDDMRELSGSRRLDSIFTPSQQREIELEYNKVLVHNKFALMFQESADITLFPDAEKDYLEFKKKVDKKKSEFEEAYFEGADTERIFALRAELSSLEYQLNTMRRKNQDLTMEVIPNKWASSYQKLVDIRKTLSKERNIGYVGSLQRSPVVDSLLVSNHFGSRWGDGVMQNGVHKGVDLVAKQGTTVVSAWSGTISDISVTKDGGNTVTITHDKGLVTRYMHLDKVTVKKGQSIRQYTPIGLSGKTGAVTTPKLHFEVWVDNKPVDPLSFFGEGGRNALKVYQSSLPDVFFTDLRKTIRGIKDYPDDLTYEYKQLETESFKVYDGKTSSAYTKGIDSAQEDSPTSLTDDDFNIKLPVKEESAK